MTALRVSWAADTAYDETDWSAENPARGQCVVSALVVQDYLGGDLQRFDVVGREIRETHYTNLLTGGVVLDTTASQYDTSDAVRLTPTVADLKGFDSLRNKRLADDSTRRRYELLKQRVQSVLNQQSLL